MRRGCRETEREARRGERRGRTLAGSGGTYLALWVNGFMACSSCSVIVTGVLGSGLRLQVGRLAELCEGSRGLLKALHCSRIRLDL